MSVLVSDTKQQFRRMRKDRRKVSTGFLHWCADLLLDKNVSVREATKRILEFKRRGLDRRARPCQKDNENGKNKNINY